MFEMTDDEGPWIALDIGGANIKAAHESGETCSVPFALWKRPKDLARVLKEVFRTLPRHSRIALTMTAELCDCYATKAEGVLEVLAATTAAAGNCPVYVWGTDARFHDVESIRSRPRIAAASNWLALAEVAARLAPSGPSLLIDIGSTTSDLVPLRDGRPHPVGRCDTERLQSGELVYAGVRRTPVCALTQELPYRGKPTAVASELFATTLDVYMILRLIAPEPSDLDTADGRPATLENARCRLARMVCADRESFSFSDAETAAQAIDEVFLRRLESAVRKACFTTIGSPRSAVISGSGEFLARRLADRILPAGSPLVSLSEIWGPAASAAACAHSLLVLARERIR